MKKRFIILIAAILVFSMLPGTCFAGNAASASSQKLNFNGKNINCEVYSINGNNYFKLRDIAQILNGTASQFSVGWDDSTSLITIVTGNTYDSLGGELQIRGDLSNQARAAQQNLMINGKEVSGLSVYNIGNNNFFKLRDLAAALNFKVDYDANTDSVLVADKESEIVFPTVQEAVKTDKSESSASSVTEQAKTQVSQNIENSAEYNFILNKNTKKIHYPDCRAVKQMKEKNKVFFEGTLEEAKAKGYDTCGICFR